MSKITMNKSDLKNLIGYVQTILDFVDTENMEEENVDIVADGYVDFVEPIIKMLKEDV